MATSTIDANPGDNSILEDNNDPNLLLGAKLGPGVSDKFIKYTSRKRAIYNN